MEGIQVLNWDTEDWETVNPQMKRKIISGAKITVAQIALKDGFVVPMHSHINEQITQVISGKMRFVFGGDDNSEVTLGPGDVIVIPADVPHEAHVIGDVFEIDTWSPRREDWINKTDDYLRSATS
ncbi:MAG: cupin domain-containing protein [Rhodothermales bacterium]|nr:cupin domain-containing protein [Rhodothermales bacterium]